MNGADKLDAAVILLLMVMLGGVLAVLAFVNIPDKNETLFAAIAGGVVGASFTAYIQWRWGSSKGSAMKDQALADMAKGQGQ